MIKKIFSQDLIKTFSGESGKREIDNSDPDLDGLIVAGVSNFSKNDLIWVVKEDLVTEESRMKLNLWLDLIGIEREVILFPLPSRDPYFNDNVTALYNSERIKLFNSIANEKKIIVIAFPLSLQLQTGSIKFFRDNCKKISKNQELHRDRFIEDLVEMGYSHESWVESPGEFKKRGGVIELFPAGQSNPLRIEFFGNRIESLTLFHPTSRYSLNEIDEISIPSSKFFGSRMHFSVIYNLKSGKDIYKLLKNPKIVCSDINAAIADSQKHLENFEKIYEINRENTDLPSPSDIFPAIDKRHYCIDIKRKYDDIENSLELVKLKKSIRNYSTDDLQKLRDDSRNGEEIYIFSPISSLIENLKNGGIWFRGIEKIIPVSFKNRKLNTLFLTEKEYRFRAVEDIYEKEFSAEQVVGSLNEGDYVVHSVHGVGRFLGTSLLKIGDIEQEFIKLEYTGREKLYVPVYEANVLNKYLSFKGVPATLDKIGGKSWKNKKIRAKKSILLFAKELLDLYAKRRSVKGFSYHADNELEGKLADSFEYIETPDQSEAIKDVLKDLEKDFPMERLVCGDVSFGKTEVAIRGAFRVVINGRQVALLCPTTILAMQHFKTFKKRLKDLPVRIEMISRMVPKKKEKDILKDVKDGKIDILIGTHSLLSEKVVFKNLGMYIIDEEQRFGVFQKEKLKKGREDLDVLSLSATPIPRTLSMSMAGLQDISVIRTPPQGRLAIKNYIGPFFKEKVISAVLNETERGGAVFIVYNSIEKIFSFKSVIEKWLPEIPITVIHAKMRTSEIEKNLMKFINGEYSVLLSTTIIENGIDISHVNTLIVIEADNYGLTQLYQLRGRIGRSRRQAYAYFFTKGLSVTDKARLRLEGIRDHSSVGAGFDLAELDLKLRGAGSLLGNRQHGHIEALGFDYYNDLLKRTVDELKGLKKREWSGTISADFKYSIDKNLVENLSDRMEIYKNISTASSLKDLDLYRKELESIYGKSGEEFEKLFFVGKAKFAASRYFCRSVALKTGVALFDFGERDISLLNFSNNFFKNFKPSFEGSGKISFHFDNFDIFFDQFVSELDNNFGSE